MQQIKVIAFDADDTLWVNEPYFRDAEKQFCKLFAHLMPEKELTELLFKTEIENLEKYGYGAKGFTLSLLETALHITDKKVDAEIVHQIIQLGKDLVDKPVELLDDIEYVLTHFKNNYRIILATKGDLLDQQRKLKKSGLSHLFHHIEVMHDKTETEYLKLIHRLDITPREFLMVGNSIKSDIIPVIALGGKAVHIPYHITWAHETVHTPHLTDFYTISKMKELIDIVNL